MRFLKKIGILFMTVFYFSVVLSKNSDLSKKQEKDLLKHISSICLEVWCSGVFDFKFHSLKCTFKHNECLLKFDFTKFHDRKKDKTINIPFSSKCVLVIAPESIFDYEEFPNFKISKNLYWKVHDCINEKSPDAWSFYEEKA